MNRRHILTLLALLPALAACGNVETVTRRIRIIAKAEVDGTPVEGSTVMEITWRASGGRMYIDTYGEALILELDGRGTVYVMPMSLDDQGRLTSGYWPYVLLRAIGIPGQGARKDLATIGAAQGRFEVHGIGNSRLLPLMVSFGDEMRKDSIFQVKPNDFAAHFGAGVRFTGFEFSFADDPVTDFLAKRLPMLVKSDPNNVFPRDPAGKLRPTSELPLAYKMSERHFILRP